MTLPALSTADMAIFFDGHHHELAAELAAAAPAIEDASRRGESGERAARIARSLGADHDLYRWLVPEDGPADVRALCLVREMLGYASPLADAIFAVQGLGASPLASAGGRFSDLLARVRRGDAVMGFALTEPEAGSDIGSLQTRADAGDGGYRLHGEKTLISNAGIATHFTVFANADPGAGRRGITAFVVPADAGGLEITPTEVNVEHPIGDLAFSGARVPAEDVIGGIGRGLVIALATLERFRVTVGAAAVGMARRALDETIARVRGRRQFGQRLADQPTVQADLATMATELDAARLLVLRAASDLDRGDARPTAQVAMAKLYATEAAQRIIDRAVQLHGGLGVTSGQVVEMLYRAIRPLRIYEGTSEIQQLIIGRALAR